MNPYYFAFGWFIGTFILKKFKEKRLWQIAFMISLFQSFIVLILSLMIKSFL